MAEMDLYDSELEFIFSQFPSYQKVGKVAYKPGLEGMEEFDKLLGHPHKRFYTIHIAGTNGKGSVSHMLASVLMKSGLRVGLYTSPHLVDFRERIKINGEMVSKEYVLEFIQKWKPYFLEKRPSFFEITTGMAFDYFAKSGVDIAVIETGLGGRLDSTNVINPLLSVITNIGLDHCEHLGYTLGDIAREKAGIIKKDTPVVIGEALPSTKKIFKLRASECNSKIVFAQDYLFHDVKAIDYNLDLKGDYQDQNVRTVLTALALISENSKFLRLASSGWSDDNIRAGLSCAAKCTGLRGRWEMLSADPKVICDTGHNSHGLKVVFSQLRKEKFDRLFILLGFVAEKDLEKIVGLLPKQAYYLITKANISRALDSEELFEKCKSVGLEGEIRLSVEDGIKYFYSIKREGDMLFIGGSTFIVAEAIQYFEKM
jgi:dihydrofolate synthase/folylpolyglutamate synthase